MFKNTFYKYQPQLPESSCLPHTAFFSMKFGIHLKHHLSKNNAVKQLEVKEAKLSGSIHSLLQGKQFLQKGEAQKRNNGVF